MNSQQESATAGRKNVIILTGGLTGSSALAGLLTAAGYWCGQDTFKKSDYNTYENAELIRLNRQLMSRVGVGEEYTTVFKPDAIAAIAALVGKEPDGDYRAMLDECGRHAPWVWKDPRLWLTIRFWDPLIEWSGVRVLLLGRDPLQSWVSTIQRRQIQTYGYLSRYNESIQQSLREFLVSRDIGFLPVQYEDVVMRPEHTLHLHRSVAAAAERLARRRGGRADLREELRRAHRMRRASRPVVPCSPRVQA
jgi:hypothetical protein